MNNTWVKEKILKDIKSYFELNENKNTTYQNFYMQRKCLEENV